MTSIVLYIPVLNQSFIDLSPQNMQTRASSEGIKERISSESFQYLFQIPSHIFEWGPLPRGVGAWGRGGEVLRMAQQKRLNETNNEQWTRIIF